MPPLVCPRRPFTADQCKRQRINCKDSCPILDSPVPEWTNSFGCRERSSPSCQAFGGYSAWKGSCSELFNSSALDPCKCRLRGRLPEDASSLGYFQKMQMTPSTARSLLEKRVSSMTCEYSQVMDVDLNVAVVNFFTELQHSRLRSSVRRISVPSQTAEVSW